MTMASKIQDKLSDLSDDALLQAYEHGLKKWMTENKEGQYTVVHICLNELVSRGFERDAMMKIRTDMTKKMIAA